MSEIDDLLDSTLDDLEDLPEFKTFPAGVHRASATMELKEVNGVMSVELAFVGMETIELAEPSKDEPIKAGDTSNTLYKLDNEFARGKLKQVLKPLGEALGTSVTREIIEQTKEVEVVILTSIRVDKTDTDRKFLNIKELNVV